MTIRMKLIVYIATMCVLLLSVSIGIGTWTINTIIYKLNTDLMSLKLDAKIDSIEDVVKLIEISGATTIEKYVRQAKTEMLQHLEESLSAENEQYYIMAGKEGRSILQVGGGHRLNIGNDVLAAMLDSRSGTATIRDEGRTYFTVYRYVDAWDWLVGVSLPAAVMFQQRRTYLMTVVLFSAIVFVGLSLLAYGIGKRLIVNPIAILVDATKAISTGNFNKTIELSQRDEIGQLADAIRTMAQQLHQNFAQIEDQFATIQRDMAERTRAEKEIRQLRNYLANIIDSMPSVLVGVGPDGCVTQWNKQAEKVTGLPFNQVMTKPVDSVLARLKDQMAQIKTAIRERRVISTPKVSRKEGLETRFEDITIFPLAANGVEGAVIRVDDVTEQVHMEEMILQSEKMLTVGGLAAGMAHEINNPLAGIIQTAEVMTNRLDNIIDKTIELAATDYDLKKQYDFKQIRIEKTYEKNLPEIPCQESKLQQVLLNILSNGAQAMQVAGTVSPRFCIKTYSDTGRDAVCIEIEDNGPGMDETTRKKVFDPFFTTKQKGVGTGLGLSVSYFIITKDHHGEMTVESRPGVGAKFIIRLPVTPARALRPEEEKGEA